MPRKSDKPPAPKWADLAGGDPSETMSTLEVATARQLQKAFREHKSKLTGRPFSISGRYKAPQAWAKAAQLCIALKADPAVFVQACFEHAHAVTLFPNSLGGRWARSTYEAWIKDRGLAEVMAPLGAVMDATGLPPQVSQPVADHILTDYLNSLRLLLSRMNLPVGQYHERSLAALDILRTAIYPFPDWFRVILFPDDEEIWARYGEGAKESLLQDVFLREACLSKHYDVTTILRRPVHVAPKHMPAMRPAHTDILTSAL